MDRAHAPNEQSRFDSVNALRNDEVSNFDLDRSRYVRTYVHCESLPIVSRDHESMSSFQWVIDRLTRSTNDLVTHERSYARTGSLLRARSNAKTKRNDPRSFVVILSFAPSISVQCLRTDEFVTAQNDHLPRSCESQPRYHTRRVANRYLRNCTLSASIVRQEYAVIGFPRGSLPSSTLKLEIEEFVEFD